jgi:hypothetical protein
MVVGGALGTGKRTEPRRIDLAEAALVDLSVAAVARIRGGALGAGKRRRGRGIYSAAAKSSGSSSDIDRRWRRC